MGLTWQQKFYQVPDEVYLVQFAEPGDSESARDVCAIVQKDEDNQKLNDKLEEFFYSEGYVLQSINFDELIIEGYEILKEHNKELYEEVR